MSTASKIEWTDTTWNPVSGCTRVSAGCDHCYAVKQTYRLEKMGQVAKYGGLTVLNNRGERHFNGVVRCHEEALGLPLRWRKPRRVFVNSMSDLFHRDVPFEFVDRVFAVMALCPRHTFQVLTKRPERMAEYLNGEGRRFSVAKAADALTVSAAVESIREEWRAIDGFAGYRVSNRGEVCGPRGLLKGEAGDQGHIRVSLYRDSRHHRLLVHRVVLTAFDRAPSAGEQAMHRDGNPSNNAMPNLSWGTQSDNWQDRKRHGHHRSYAKLDAEKVEEIRRLLRCGHPADRIGRQFGVSGTQVRNIAAGDQWAETGDLPWPLPGVWLGTSVEDQAAADERIPHSLARISTH